MSDQTGSAIIPGMSTLCMHEMCNSCSGFDCNCSCHKEAMSHESSSAKELLKQCEEFVAEELQCRERLFLHLDERAHCITDARDLLKAIRAALGEEQQP